jgi:exopolysaccharide biosynthesis polyprenyl glycosylphosphotransferase
MAISRRREALLLFFGDIFFLSLALITTLAVRYSELPGAYYLYIHFVPFSILFLASTLVFFIAGLYEKHTLPMKSTLPASVLYAQIATMVLAAALFFFVPFFGLQPKAFLFIYLVFSTLYVSVWRIYLYPRISVQKPEPALLIGAGPEAREIFEEINGNTRYTIRFDYFYDTSREPLRGEEIRRLLDVHQAAVVVLPASVAKDTSFMSAWSTMKKKGVQFLDQAQLYEELFDRVALSSVDERILLEKPESALAMLYAAVKRGFDILASACALIILSPMLLVVGLVLKASGGSALIFQERVGKGNTTIKIIKFRTMLFDDGGDSEKQKQNRVTAFGAFLRRTIIDELPQFWNVLRGDLSLIGPRPEMPLLVSEYEKQIPFYAVRHSIQPGMSGWAQVKHASPPKWRLDVDATWKKLSYDLYYMKYRSLRLDFVIALRTIQILLSRGG